MKKNGVNKFCNKCKEAKLISDFRKDKSRSDGYMPICNICDKIKGQTYRKNNQEKISKTRKLYEIKNKTKISTRKRLKSQTDIPTKLRLNLRRRLLHALKKNFKTGSAVSELGCSIAEFKLYIEAQFEPGMTWNNYGKWHLDHIIPLSWFDLTDRQELLEACNYLNIRPAWATENVRRGNRWI